MGPLLPVGGAAADLDSGGDSQGQWAGVLDGEVPGHRRSARNHAEIRMVGGRRRDIPGNDLDAIARDPDFGPIAAGHIPHEDVGHAVAVVGDEAAGNRREHDKAASGVDRTTARPVTGLLAFLGHADTCHAAVLPVVAEHIARAIGIARDQVGGVRREADIAAIRADAGV